MNDSNDSLASSIILFLVGAAVGAAVVALTTPKTGPELRSDLKDLGLRMKDRVRRAGADLRHDAEDLVRG